MATATKLTRAEQRLLDAALAVGLPMDALDNFAEGDYCPQRKQLEFHAACREADADPGPTQIGFGGARGPGKALSLDTSIPVPTGWTTMGEIEVGDSVFAIDGSVARVTGCSQIQYDRKCYEVVFSDGARIIADEEHLWLTFTKADRQALKRRTSEFRDKRRASRTSRGKGLKPWLAERNKNNPPKTLLPPVGSVQTTAEILQSLFVKNEVNHSVPVCGAIECPLIDLLLDPYILGLWLGDGDSARGYLTSVDDEIIEQVRDAGWKITKSPSGNMRYVITGLTAVLSALKVRGDKHIPAEYLRGSSEQRLALLQGLMDTDGCVDQDGSCEFTSTKYVLASGLMELALSLGFKSTIAEGVATLNGRQISPKWRVRFTTETPCFRLTRKLNKQKRTRFNGTTKMRYIVAVNEAAGVPVRCITIDHPSHCFLAGRNFIPTHNSHGLFAQVALDDCQRVDALKCLYLRKIGKNAREQFEDLRRAVLKFTPHEFKSQSGTVIFPNGSRILIGHFNNESDIDNYLGLEYDLIAIEEATTLTESKYKALRDSNRTSKTNWRPRIYATTNPGGVGHAWFKKRFIEPARSLIETDTRFIFATVDDNVFLDRDYVNKLNENTGWKLKAYRHGDWDIAAGQFFTTFRYDIHSVEPDTIPRISPQVVEYWGSLDYGWNHYTVFYLFMRHDGITYVLGEHADRMQSIPYHAEQIHGLLKSFGLEYGDLSTVVAGTDVFAQRGAKNAETIGDQYEAEGIYLRPANTDRVNGAAKILQLLGDEDRNIPAKIKISRNCVRLLECLPVLEHDPNRPEDVKKVDTDESGNGGDDPYDGVRYGVTVNNSIGVYI